jgi:thiol-disulfide isomerase/thioredoxin
MQRVLFWLLLALATGAADAARVGDPMPGFELPRADGRVLAAADLAGKVVLVDFWASWCAPCRKSFPFLGELQQRHAGDGFVVLGINVDEERSEADRFLAAVPAAFEIVFDPEGASPKAFAVKAMPSSYLVGRDGRIVQVNLGFREQDKAGLASAVRELLAEEAAP